MNFKILIVRPVSGAKSLVAEVSCQYGELEIHEIMIFQNGNKGPQVVWPRQRPKGGWSKWTPIVVPSEKAKMDLEPIILDAVKQKLAEAPF